MEISELSLMEFEPAGAHVLFWTYYSALMEEARGALPKRTDFDPLKVASVLHKLAVSEYIDEETQIVKLIGGGHDNLWPPNMAGKNLYDFLDEEMKASRRSIYKQIIARPCGAIVDDLAIDTTGHAVRYSGLILPTLSYDGKPTIFIGCYDFYADDIEMQACGEAGIASRKTISVQYVDLGQAA